MPKEVEDLRLKEIEEHFYQFKHQVDLRNQFDLILYNHYNEQSKQELIQSIKAKLDQAERK